MASYYIDETLGSDGGTGEIGDPWETISKVNGESFSGDDNIYFKKGEEWREQLSIPSDGTSGHQITFSSYGSGAKPIINGADLYGDVWSDASPPTNSWSATCTTEPKQVFFNGTRGIKETAEANLSAATEWFWAANVLYVYSTSDPHTAYTNPGIEASIRDQCINSWDDDYIDITNLDLKYPNKHCIYVSGGSDYWNIYDNDITYSAQRGVFTESDYTKIYNNTLSYNGVDLATQEHAIYFDGSDYGEAYENEISYSNCAGVKVDGGNGTKVYRNYLHHCNQENQWTGAIHVTDFGGNCSNVDVYYNLIEESGGYAIEIFNGGAGIISNINIYNNTIYDTGVTGRGYAVRFENVTSGTLNFKNNIIHTGQIYAIRYDNNVGATINRDYNCYYGWTHATYIGSIDGASVTWAAVSATETNSINSDPSFINAGSSDFHLQVGSPCRNVGTDVGLTQDYDGVSVPQETNPAIGAFEYVGTQVISAVGNISSTEAFGGSLLYFLNRMYDKGREAFLGGDIDFASDTIKAVLVDSADYTLDLATHEFLDDIPSVAQVAISDALTGKSTTNGIADATDLIIATVSGDKFEYIVLFKDTGDSATSPLIMCIDSAVGLPFTPEGGSVKLKWSDLVTKIFKL